MHVKISVKKRQMHVKKRHSKKIKAMSNAKVFVYKYIVINSKWAQQ